MSSVYIHFPYCLYKCHYCDFNSYATDPDKIPFESYLQALKKELRLRKEYFDQHGFGFFHSQKIIKTIFFGGGTPSLMPPQHISLILDELAHFFVIDPTCEITLEANPGTLTEQKIHDFHTAGINRISIGVQSLNESYLSRFGRIHSALDAKNVLGWLASSSLKSWNADLMFGFPGETQKEWNQTLSELVTYEPPHLSCYAFTVEAEAPYGRWVAQGKAVAPSDELQFAMMQDTQSKLAQLGYQAYEISNYSKPEFECRHNLAYWRYQNYLGLGAGAVSLFTNSSESKSGNNFVVRTTNQKNPDRYQKTIGDGVDFFEKEEIAENLAQLEFVMMNLRLKDGFTADHFKSCFNQELSQAFVEAIEKCRAKKWIQSDRIALTQEGVLLANQVILEFM